MVNYELATARSRTIQVPPTVSEAFPVAKTFVCRAASLPKTKKLQPSPVSLFYDLRRTAMTFARRGGGELATARFPRTPQLPLSFNESFYAAKMFFLAASQLKVNKLNRFQEYDPFPKYCTVVT